MKPVLETERLVARAWTTRDEDLAAAYDIYERPEVAHWLDAPTEAAQIRVRIAHW